jgi:predicted dehydrogenase
MSGNNKNIAIVGCGYWGKNLVRNFAELGALRAICDASSVTLASLQSQFDAVGVTEFAEILAIPEVQGVVIATPAPTHAQLVIEALAAGKDVFVEKPLALSLEEAMAIKTAASKSDRILMVGHLLEYHPALVELRRLAAENLLGKIQYLYSNRLSFGKVRTEENVLWSFAPHDICSILGFLGETPQRVRASGSDRGNRIADFCTIEMEFANNVQAHIFVSWLHPFKEQRLVVVGDAAMAVFDDVVKDNKLTVTECESELQNGVFTPKKGQQRVIEIDRAEPLKQECQHFLDCMATRTPPRTGMQNGIDVLTVLQAAQQSLDAGGNTIEIKEMELVRS